MLTWARRRQFSYLFAFLAFFGLLGFSSWLIFKPAPTCFDGRQNGNETGLDCGGDCLLACVEESRPLSILWTRALPVAPGRYDLVALVENVNRDLGARRQDYAFSIYGEDNALLARRTGETFVNPGETFVIFESRLEVEDRPVGKVFLELADQTAWQKALPGVKEISLTRRGFTNEPKPLLLLAVDNTGASVARDLEVVAILSDLNRNAMAASATVLDRLAPGERQEISLTWPEAFVAEPSYFDFYWRLNDLAGAD